MLLLLSITSGLFMHSVKTMSKNIFCFGILKKSITFNFLIKIVIYDLYYEERMGGNLHFKELSLPEVGTLMDRAVL